MSQPTRAPPLPGLKRCSACGKDLPLGWYVSNGTRAGSPRLRSRCRECLRPKRSADRVIRRARLKRGRTITERVTERDLAALAERQNYRCACGCGASIRFTFHVEHRIPLAKGGRHTLSNLQLMTPVCNLRKGAR